MKQKYCYCCRQWKPETDFGIVSNKKDGRRGRCKSCESHRRQEVFLKNPEAHRETNRKYMKEYHLRPIGRYYGLKGNCEVSGTSLSISKDDFLDWYDQQPKTCYYCSAKLVVGGARKDLRGLTIDRKDNDKGYSLDNIVLACRRCNLMKGSWLTEQQTLVIAQKYFIHYQPTK